MMPKLEMVELILNTFAQIHELLQVTWGIVLAITGSDAFISMWECALVALRQIASMIVSQEILTTLYYILTLLRKRERDKSPISPTVRLDISRLKREANKRTLILPMIRHSKRKASRDKTPTPKRLR